MNRHQRRKLAANRHRGHEMKRNGNLYVPSRLAQPSPQEQVTAIQHRLETLRAIYNLALVGLDPNRIPAIPRPSWARR